uniref:Uncharacterized protein n=1 Tax=Glossina brevipalpis TaxID=37001 RepID=A0A1A9W3S7_9MUSC
MEMQSKAAMPTQLQLLWKTTLVAQSSTYRFRASCNKLRTPVVIGNLALAIMILIFLQTMLTRYELTELDSDEDDNARNLYYNNAAIRLVVVTTLLKNLKNYRKNPKNYQRSQEKLKMANLKVLAK